MIAKSGRGDAWDSHCRSANWGLGKPRSDVRGRWASAGVTPLSVERRKVNQPCIRRPEATRVEVERLKLGIEVDVEPFATRGLRVSRCEANYACTDLFVLNGAARLGVDQERVIAAVACDVDETNESVALGSGSHPTEAVRAYLVPPSGGGSSAV